MTPPKASIPPRSRSIKSTLPASASTCIATGVRICTDVSFRRRISLVGKMCDGAGDAGEFQGRGIAPPAPRGVSLGGRADLRLDSATVREAHMRVFITYKLRKGVSRDRYRRWSREVDQVVASRQPGVLSYA